MTGIPNWSKRPLVPTNDESLAMLARVKHSGRSVEWIAAVCGVEANQVALWLRVGAKLTGPSRRGIWWAYVLACQPELAATEFDVLTWGRFVKPKPADCGKPIGQQSNDDTTGGGV